jgi:hypothetical protein
MDARKSTLTFWFSIVILVVWVISFFADMVMEEYSPPPSIHALMLIVAGALYGEGVFRRANGHEASHPPAPEETKQ